MPRISVASMARYLVVAACFAISSSFVLAQYQPPPTRDPAALAVLNQAIVAMGGLSAVTSIQTIQVQGHMTLRDSGENSSFQLSYLIANNGVRFSRSKTTSKGVSIFGSGKGVPFLSLPNGRTETFGHHMATAVPYEHPALAILLDIQNTNYSITMAPPSKDGFIRIHAEDDTSDDSRSTSPQDWYLDPSTYVPARVEYKLPDAFHPSVTQFTACKYLSYQLAGTEIVPSSIEVDDSDGAVADIKLDAFTFNVTLTDNFDMPGGN